MADTAETRQLTVEEFTERFATYLVEKIGTHFDDGCSIRDYAEDIASTYWADPSCYYMTPEDCAETDMEYLRDG